MHKCKHLILFLIIVFGSFNISAQKDSLKVVSWNVFLLPKLMFKDYQLDRIDSIAKVLKAGNYDVICLQEVFDKKYKKKLIKQLKNEYPYYYFNPKKGLLKTNNGLITFSKIPIDSTAYIVYKKRTWPDNMAKKGAIKTYLTINSKQVIITNTHVQSKEEEHIVRGQQMVQLAEFIAQDNDKTKVLLGDLNTVKLSDEYGVMMNTLKLKDGDITDSLKISGNTNNNCLAPSDSEKEEVLIDYILHSENCKVIQRKIHCFKASYHEKCNNLSDHNAVEGIVVF